MEPKILELIAQLQQKYDKSGQDMSSYLEGLLYTEYLSYWDYIRLDSLLSLQAPKTDFPDETVFIVYHQITELFLLLVLHELEQLSSQAEEPKVEFVKDRLGRMVRYFNNLVLSFQTMQDGMEYGQFLKFRMSLLPASGFQSGQFRMVEILSTDTHLLSHSDLPVDATASWAEKMEKLYWRSGATELATGQKTLTLVQFEKKYMKTFEELAQKHEKSNLRQILKNLQTKGLADEALINAFKEYDLLVNVRWKLAHYKSAVRYLDRSPEAIAATGGTNWQKYLPPRFQKKSFFPELWSAEELENWGRSWVEETLAEIHKARG